jgi:RimJ/RimL family protein N-acetyltransferase
MAADDRAPGDVQDAHELLDKITWPVRTDRLWLRRATADDTDAIWSWRRLEEVSRWLTFWCADRDEFAAKDLTGERRGRTILIERDGTAVGELMLRITDAWAQAEVTDLAKGVHAELGWVLAPQHAGNGYATEAVEAALRLCFVDLRLRRVFADCFAENTASWRLMERVGMRRETHNVRDALHRDGTWRDGYGYAILAEEWFERHSPGG